LVTVLISVCCCCTIAVGVLGVAFKSGMFKKKGKSKYMPQDDDEDYEQGYDDQYQDYPQEDAPYPPDTYQQGGPYDQPGAPYDQPGAYPETQAANVYPPPQTQGYVQ
jgi:hypothetical protein